MLHIITGPPRSGLNLLSNCLNLLGIPTLDAKSTMTAEAINNQLLQDLGVSPWTPSLHQDWMSTPAAINAKKRIHKLLSDKPLSRKTFPPHTSTLKTDTKITENSQYQLTINNSLLTALWLQTVTEVGLKPHCIVIIRHPYEIALALHNKHNLDLTQAQILWLAHIRAATRALEWQEYSLVTFDQLLADPISICNSFINFSPKKKQFLAANIPALLDYVQPNLKHYHTSDYSVQAKKLHKPFVNIYTQLRDDPLSVGTNDQVIEILLDAQSQISKLLSSDISSVQQFLAEPLIWSRTEHVHALNVLLTTHKNMEVLKSFLPSLPEEKKAKMYRDCLNVEHVNAGYHVIMKTIADNNKIVFKDAEITYYDDWGIWTCMDELLVHQEYYFTAETDEPRILDCGANIGLAVYYFKHLYPKAKITAFEPVPAFRELIEKNVADNEWQDVEVLPYAIDGTDDEVIFYVSKKMSLAGTLTERRKVAGDELEIITVQKKRLRHYLKQPIDYLKLDIEGSEDAALLDAAPLLGNVQYIFCEYHHALGMETDRLKKILNVLDLAGFDYHVSKSVNFVKTSSFKPMLKVGKPYSALVFAKNKNWKK